MKALAKAALCAAPAAAFLVFSATATVAQDQELDRDVISGGGGTASSGGITINGTIGQPVGAVAASGDTNVSGGFWGAELTIQLEPDESFEQWMENLPEKEMPPEGQRGPDDTPAGDGVANLLKYAFGLMPLTPAPEATPTAVDAGGFLALELERSPEAAVEFYLEGSSDFEEWVEVPHLEEVIDPDSGDNRERIRLLSELDIDEHRSYFLRLRVVMP